MKKLFFVTLLIQFNFIQSDYSVHPRADFVVNELVNSYGFDKKEVLEVLKNAKKQQTIIDRISTPAEFTITWDAYRNIFIEEKRIKNGKKFIEDNLPALKKAEEEFGVPKEIKLQEHRIGLTPESEKFLTKKGHQVLIQANGGVEAGFTNEDYISAGGKIIQTASEIFKKSDIIVKVKEPQMSEVPMI